MSPQFLVCDLNRSSEFYTEKSGFAPEFRYENFYGGILKDGCSIHLKSGCPSFDKRKTGRVTEDLDLVFLVDKIEDLYQEILNKSEEIIQPMRNMPYSREFYITDPDRHIIGFVEAGG